MDEDMKSRSRRPGVALIAALVLAVMLGGLTVTIGYGFTVEYGDTSAPALEAAWHTVRDWAFGVGLTAAVALGAALSARRLRWVTVVALGVVAGTVLGLAVAGVVGTAAKYARYPDVPNCTDEFDGGPAMPVTRAAQRGFEAIEHPAPFSGGGSSGVDGCSSELMLRDGQDAGPHYRTALPADGWTIVTDTDEVLRAEKAGQAFELTLDDVGSSTVWIGPEGLGRRVLEDGQVGPRK